MEMDIEFLMVNRYGEGSNISIAMDLFSDIGGRHVIVVVGLVDTGLTLRAIRSLLARTGPRRRWPPWPSSTGAVRRASEVPLEHRGFEVGDHFLVGYGLDWEGRYRGLPSIWAVHDPAALQTDPYILDGAVFGDQ